MAACVSVMVFISVWMLGSAYSVPSYRDATGICTGNDITHHTNVTRGMCAGLCSGMSECLGWTWLNIGTTDHCYSKSKMCETLSFCPSRFTCTVYYKILTKASQSFYVAIEAGTTFYLSAPLAAEGGSSMIGCGALCLGTADCYIYRLTADNMCTLYNLGNVKTPINNQQEWYKADSGV